MSKSQAPSSTDRRTCPECSGRLATDHKHGEVACQECGLVVADGQVDTGPEWREFDEQDREGRSRVGPPTTGTRHDRGLSTNIDWRDKDAYGNTLSARKREQMQRLRTWNERFRTRNHQERNLKQALGEIDRMGSALGLPEDVRETASVVYRRAQQEDLLRGRSMEGVATASVYAAARQAGLPRSLDEFATVSRVEKADIGRTYRYLTRKLELGIGPADPGDYVGRFVSDLGFDSEVEYRAYELLETASEEGLDVGRSPVSMAASAVYAAALLAECEVTQEAVEEATDVSQVTIRSRYRELLAADADAPLRSA
jgi:transcription initiation factor TFIIB